MPNGQGLRAGAFGADLHDLFRERTRVNCPLTRLLTALFDSRQVQLKANVSAFGPLLFLLPPQGVGGINQ